MGTETGIIMDILTLGILLLSTALGSRKGFALTVASFMQWFVCMILGFLLCGSAKGVLEDYTSLDEFIQTAITNHIRTTIEESSSYRVLPDLFSGWINDGADSFSTITAASMTSALMTVVAFLAVVFALKVVAFLFIHLLSRRYHDGVTGFIDGFFGFLFGFARGLILAMLFFAVLVPLLGILWPDLSEPIADAIAHSGIASVFYDNNVLLILIRDFFS